MHTNLRQFELLLLLLCTLYKMASQTRSLGPPGRGRAVAKLFNGFTDLSLVMGNPGLMRKVLLFVCAASQPPIL